jgi:sialidase-1
MKKRVFAFFISIACLATAFAQTEKIPVFLSGTDGYQSYRIPAIIRMPNGDLLAFCEGRAQTRRGI